MKRLDTSIMFRGRLNTGTTGIAGEQGGGTGIWGTGYVYGGDRGVGRDLDGIDGSLVALCCGVLSLSLLPELGGVGHEFGLYKVSLTRPCHPPGDLDLLVSCGGAGENSRSGPA